MLGVILESFALVLIQGFFTGLGFVLAVRLTGGLHVHQR